MQFLKNIGHYFYEGWRSKDTKSPYKTALGKLRRLDPKTLYANNKYKRIDLAYNDIARYISVTSGVVAIINSNGSIPSGFFTNRTDNIYFHQFFVSSNGTLLERERNCCELLKNCIAILEYMWVNEDTYQSIEASTNVTRLYGLVRNIISILEVLE